MSTAVIVRRAALAGRPRQQSQLDPGREAKPGPPPAFLVDFDDVQQRCGQLRADQFGERPQLSGRPLWTEWADCLLVYAPTVPTPRRNCRSWMPTGTTSPRSPQTSLEGILPGQPRRYPTAIRAALPSIQPRIGLMRLGAP